jgi:hypothetical protein
MIKLSNGATVHAVFLLPAGLGTKPHGVVLGETGTDWVTWHVYDDGKFVINDEITTRAGASEVWEAEMGHYFQKSGFESERMARFDYGLRLRRFLSEDTLSGVKS